MLAAGARAFQCVRGLPLITEILNFYWLSRVSIHVVLLLAVNPDWGKTARFSISSQILPLKILENGFNLFFAL